MPLSYATGDECTLYSTVYRLANTSASTSACTAWHRWTTTATGPDEYTIVSQHDEWTDDGSATCTWIKWMSYDGGLKYHPVTAVTKQKPVVEPVELTEEEKQQKEEKRLAAQAAYEERRIEHERLHKEWQEHQELINTRAKTLLLSLLDEQQKQDYERRRDFVVKAQSGKRYLVQCTSRSGNVVELDDEDRKIARYCLHSSEAVPLCDDIIVAVLMLRGHEEEYLRIANMTCLYTPDRREQQAPQQPAEIAA